MSKFLPPSQQNESASQTAKVTERIISDLHFCEKFMKKRKKNSWKYNTQQESKQKVATFFKSNQNFKIFSRTFWQKKFVFRKECAMTIWRIFLAFLELVEFTELPSNWFGQKQKKKK